jgi:hypothetical protein
LQFDLIFLFIFPLAMLRSQNPPERNQRRQPQRKAHDKQEKLQQQGRQTRFTEAHGIQSIIAAASFSSTSFANELFTRKISNYEAEFQRFNEI